MDRNQQVKLYIEIDFGSELPDNDHLESIIELCREQGAVEKATLCTSQPVVRDLTQEF